eukprot:2142281-Rhodomonas_salina.1
MFNSVVACAPGTNVPVIIPPAARSMIVAVQTTNGGCGTASQDRGARGAGAGGPGFGGARRPLWAVVGGGDSGPVRSQNLRVVALLGAVAPPWNLQCTREGCVESRNFVRRRFD